MPTFDELKDLAKRDPDGFERLRSELIEDCINRCSPRNHRRLKGLQFVIEAKRLIAGNSMKALMQIQAMMYESLLSLQQAVLSHQCLSDPSVSGVSGKQSGVVLPGPATGQFDLQGKAEEGPY